eukprot:gene25363-biopygen21886
MPVLSQGLAVAATDLDAIECPGHRIEAGGEHQCVEFVVRVGRLDPGLVDCLDRCALEIDQAHVVTVVALVVVGVRHDPLGPDGVVVRDQQVGDGLIFDHRSDLGLGKCGRRRVGVDVAGLVGEGFGEQDTAELPPLLVGRVSLGLGYLERAARIRNERRSTATALGQRSTRNI